jgi:hypothetical protein
MDHAVFLSTINCQSRTAGAVIRMPRAGKPEFFEKVITDYHVLSFSLHFREVTNVSGQVRDSMKAQLALAVARGIPIAKWARKSGVPAPTAFRWAREPEVRTAIEEYRGRMIDEAVGRMTTRCSKAADIHYETARYGDSMSLRFRAARAIFSDMMTVSKYSRAEAAVAEVEPMLETQPADGASGTGTQRWREDGASDGVGVAQPAVHSGAPGNTGSALFDTEDECNAPNELGLTAVGDFH